MKRTIYFYVCVAMLLTMGMTAGRSEAQTNGESEGVTGTCTGTPCPFGAALYTEAIVWPATYYPADYWLRYSMSAANFLPADTANGITVKITTGSATAYAAAPGAMKLRVLATMTEGQSYQVDGLAADEKLSVHSGDVFSYEYVLPEGFEPPDPPVDPGLLSEEVTVTCTGAPCPFGTDLNAEAIVWPADFYQVDSWLGYLMSPAFFLPADTANGITVKITTGSATAYAVAPGVTKLRVLATMTEGQSYQVGTLAADEWLSVHSGGTFSYEYNLPPDPVDPDAEFTTMVSVESKWVCDMPDCSVPDWTGAVIDWPAWSAYESNGRPGDGSRTVYSMDDVLLYPYMGPWADGCSIRVESGTAYVIEWQRGSEEWRTREMGPGETHVIDLVSPEDNALIEGSPGFVVSVANCDPQPL